MKVHDSFLVSVPLRGKDRKLLAFLLYRKILIQKSKVSVPLRGKDRKLPPSSHSNGSYQFLNGVSVPLRGKDRKLLDLFITIPECKPWVSVFPSPCGEKIENYENNPDRYQSVVTSVTRFRPLAGKR
jgi:hypothetical protein